MNKTLTTEQDADQLLRAFFQSEMPHPWPAFEPPVPRTTLPFRPAAAPRRRFVLGSKLALAASVALLMLCGWLLSGAFEGPTKTHLPFNRTGDEGAEKDKGRHQDVPLQPKDKKAGEGDPFGDMRQN
jgi:hypothetical protein